ncbi:MAG: hypothetical protein R3Y15_00965 [Rikenellaceae bacterium]
MTIKVSLVQPTLGLNEGSVVREKVITLSFCSKIVVEGSSSSSGGQSISWDDIDDKPTIPDIDGLATEEYVDEVFAGIEIPTTLPNPNAITINGTSYDGSSAVNLTIDAGGSGDVVNINLTPFLDEQSGTMSSVDYDSILGCLTSMGSKSIQGYISNFGLVPVMLLAGEYLTLSANMSTLSDTEEGVVTATHLVVHISGDYSWTSSLKQISLSDTEMLENYIDSKIGDIDSLLDELNGEEI